VSINYGSKSIHEVVEALEPLKSIERPEGDNEGDPIDAASVYDRLPPHHQEVVDRARTVAALYVRKAGDAGAEPDSRSITELNKKGFKASLNQDQEDPTRLVGLVAVGEWTLSLSDPTNESAED